MAEPRIVVAHREHLWWLLAEASQLEHMIMSQYLFAEFSLKDSTGEGLTGEQAAAVDRWRTTLHGIAVEEMLHLALRVLSGRPTDGSAAVRRAGAAALSLPGTARRYGTPGRRRVRSRRPAARGGGRLLLAHHCISATDICTVHMRPCGRPTTVRRRSPRHWLSTYPRHCAERNLDARVSAGRHDESAPAVTVPPRGPSASRCTA